MHCIVCHVSKTPPVVRNGIQDRWHSTSQRTPLVGVQILFKLYDVTKTEFESGFLCVLCFDLITQIESLECQLKSQVDRGKRNGRAGVIDGIINNHEEAQPWQMHHAEVVTEREKITDDWGSDGEDHGSLGGEDIPELETEVREAKETETSLWTSEEEGIKDGMERLAADDETMSNESREYNTQEQNLDFDVTSQRSRTGRDIIAYQGFKYFLSPRRGAKKNSTESTTQEWRCLKAKCKAKLTTYQNETCVLKDTVMAHNHPRNRVYNVQESNLDFNLSVGRNSRENDSLTYQGYKYRPAPMAKAQDKNSETMATWRCRYSKCRGRVVTFMNDQCVLKDTVIEHDHPPIGKKLLLYEEFQDTIRKIISDHPEMPPDIVFSSAQLLCPHIPIVKTKPLREFIRRTQAKKRKAHEDGSL